MKQDETIKGIQKDLHDVNNLLGYVMGASELVLDNIKAKEEELNEDFSFAKERLSKSIRQCIPIGEKIHKVQRFIKDIKEYTLSLEGSDNEYIGMP